MIQYKEINGEEQAFLTKDALQKVVYQKMRRAFIPKDYIGIPLSDLEANLGPEIINTCLNFQGIGLYLEGPNSQGKTTLACKIAEKAISEGGSALFLLAGDLQYYLMQNDGYGSSDQAYILERAHTVDLLVIDDAWDPAKMLLWKKDSAQMQISVWDRFIRRRLGNSKRIVFTSNIPMKDVHKKYGLSMGHLLYRNFLQIQVMAKSDLLKKQRADLWQQNGI